MTTHPTVAELAAEVDRLKQGKFTQEELQQLCHTFRTDDRCAFKHGCRQYWRELFKDESGGNTDVVYITYTNWEGRTSERKIRPKCLYFGSTEYHQGLQWLLEADDLDKHETRTFAVKDIVDWVPA